MFREFRKHTGRNKKPQVWKIGIDKNDPETYVVEWGVLNGAVQTTKDRPDSCGTEGHANFQTPAQYAQFCIDREIRKKNEEGYIEYINGEPVKEVVNFIDFNKPLPKNFCLYKPKLEIDDEKLEKLHKENRAVWTLKRDGMMHIALRRQNNWEIYSRRMDLVTEKYPHIVENLNKLDLPDSTMLIGEMVFLREDGSDDFKNVSRICRSKEDLALAYQGFGSFPKNKKDEKVLGKVSFYVFDVPFFEGADLIKNRNIIFRLRLLKQIFQFFNPRLFVNSGNSCDEEQLKNENRRRERMLREYHIAPLKIYKTTASRDRELIKNLNLEGFVILDTDACYGDRGYSFDGKAQRPEGIYKRKCKLEEEFIISGIYEGSGRNRGRFGGFTLEQYHPETGNIIDCGKCGGGFTDEHRDRFLDKDLIGKTIKVEFDSRQPPNKGIYAVRFPVFKGWADKTPEECIAQYIPEEE